MTSYKLVMPEHMNQYGGLFGGYLLQWVDETAWIAVSLDYPGKRFVTIGLSKVVFKKPAFGGAILRFEVARVREGGTSVTYGVQVFCRPANSDQEDAIFATQITFVRVDAEGQKTPVNDPPDLPLEPEPSE